MTTLIQNYYNNIPYEAINSIYPGVFKKSYIKGYILNRTSKDKITLDK